MKKESLDFLKKLIKTPAPSGNEVEVQKVWMDYVKGFAQKIETDTVGNVIASVNSDADFKVMIAGHSDEIAFMVNYIDSDGYIYVKKVGGINPKLALGMRVRILTKNGVIKGVVGVKAEHQGGAKDKIEEKDIFIDCGAKDKENASKYISIGDYIIYDVDYEYHLNNNLVGRALDNKTGAFIVAEVLRYIADKNPKIGVYAVSTVNEETNMGGVYFAASHIKPTMAITCDVTFATDYPGIDYKESGCIKVGKGPVLSKGALINEKINELLEKAGKENDIRLQYELTPNMIGIDKVRLTGNGVPIALVSLPLRYMHSPSEIVNLDDIEKEIKLIASMILSMNGNENLKLF